MYTFSIYIVHVSDLHATYDHKDPLCPGHRVENYNGEYME